MIIITIPNLEKADNYFSDLHRRLYINGLNYYHTANKRNNLINYAAALH